MKYETGDTTKVLGFEATITEIHLGDGYVTFNLVADEFLSSQRVSFSLREFGDVDYHQQIVDEEVKQSVELEIGEVWNA